jgi:hypothetical protein
MGPNSPASEHKVLKNKDYPTTLDRTMPLQDNLLKSFIFSLLLPQFSRWCGNRMFIGRGVALQNDVVV